MININIFDLQRFEWWRHMERIMENVNLDEILILQKDSIDFIFSNSYNGNFYKKIRCERVIKFVMESEAFVESEFAYFVGDVYLQELGIEELENALNYYHYGYNVKTFDLGKQYLLSIIGNDISIDVLCGRTELM